MFNCGAIELLMIFCVYLWTGTARQKLCISPCSAHVSMRSTFPSSGPFSLCISSRSSAWRWSARLRYVQYNCADVSKLIICCWLCTEAHDWLLVMYCSIWFATGTYHSVMARRSTAARRTQAKWSSRSYNGLDLGWLCVQFCFVVVYFCYLSVQSLFFVFYSFTSAS